MFSKAERDFIRNFLDWDASSYYYSRDVLDSKPYKMKYEEDKTTIIFNMLGVSKDDIHIEITREHGIDYLNISGETKDTLLTKNSNSGGRFKLDSEAVKNIEWTTRDGLLFVEIHFKEPEKSKIKITTK